MRTINDFALMAPMKYYASDDEHNIRRAAMLSNAAADYVASEKHDGDWSMAIHYTKGNNLIRSRSISKITGVYGDYTAKLPHLTEEMDKWPDNTVMLMEICWDKYGTNANTVGTILRCLPEKAVARQKENKLYGLAFDFLMIDGQDMTDKPYIERLEAISKFLISIDSFYIKPTQIFYDNFEEAADSIIAAGGEGVVIQRKDNPYMPGTRTAWKTLKLKQALPSADYKVIGVLEPKKMYEGDCADTWQYWYQNIIGADPTLGNFPVTKPYFMGWKNGITIQLPSGEITEVTSGLTDADREWLASPEAADQIRNGELWAEVKAMSINDLGKLRHPALVRLRSDLGATGE